MYEQINASFSDMTKQFADAAIQANTIAFENAERIFGLQLKTLEANLSATAGFYAEAAEIRQIEELRALLPKGAQIAKENAERSIQAGQEAFGESLRTQQVLGQLIKGQFDAAGERVSNAAGKAAKAAK